MERTTSREIRLLPLRAQDGAAAIEVLRSGFLEDPTMRWCFDARSPGYAERLDGYLRTGHRWHTALGFPVLGAYQEGEDSADPSLVGVSYEVEPGIEVAPDQLRELERAMIDTCGEASAQRFAHYNEAVDAVLPDAPCHTLALLAVLPGARGLGIGSRLVENLSERADASAHSHGVALDTGNPRNLPFYARLGFEEVAAVEIGSAEPPAAEIGTLTEHVLVRPRSVRIPSGGRGSRAPS